MNRKSNTIRVAVPVKLARLRVWVDKGRHWSGVDRLVLWALSVQPQTAANLAADACLPARLVNEIILRMMRFGWVELAAARKGAAFRATRAGREAIETFDVLPPVIKRTARRVSFVMEPFEWRAFGLRDLKPYRPSELDTIERDHDVRRIIVDGGWGNMSAHDLYGAVDQVLTDDEELSSVDFNASATLDQFALFTIVGDKIKGLPLDAPSNLVNALHRAAAGTEAGAGIRARSTRRPASARAELTGPVSTPPINPSDLILTGPDHRELLLDVLRHARERVVMHSTFLREAAFLELEDEFRRAAKRGVRIDMFWGAAKDEKSRTANLEAAIAINHRIGTDHHLRNRARVHLYSTRSHAKLLIADRGSRRGA